MLDLPKITECAANTIIRLASTCSTVNSPSLASVVDPILIRDQCRRYP